MVGGGDTAMEEATFLTRYAAKVYVVHRRDKLRASKIMQDKAFQNEKIEFIWNTAVEEILGEPEAGVTGVRLRNLQTNEERDSALRRRLHRHRPQAKHGSFQGTDWTWTKLVTSRLRIVQRRRMCRECLPAATCRTTVIVRQ